MIKKRGTSKGTYKVSTSDIKTKTGLSGVSTKWCLLYLGEGIETEEALKEAQDVSKPSTAEPKKRRVSEISPQERMLPGNPNSEPKEEKISDKLREKL